MNNDLISREYIKLFVCEYEKFNGKETEIVKAVPIQAIDNAPTVCGNNPKWCESCISKGKCASTRQTGEWIDEGQYAENYGEHAYRCKECGYHIITHPNMLFEKRYCENCGAEMRKGAKKNGDSN